MTAITVPHRVTAACTLDHCSFHDVDEPGTGYLTCAECGHLYRTAEEMQAEWRANAPPELRDGPVPDPVDIWFCPLCAHNF